MQYILFVQMILLEFIWFFTMINLFHISFLKESKYYTIALFNSNFDYISISMKHRTVISQCFDKIPLDHSNHNFFNHHDYMNYSRCILDHSPIMSSKEKEAGILLIVDSFCPLGIEITQQLRDQQIDHIDIRGQQHLDINSDAGKQILNQFHISKALIVCDSLMSRKFSYVSNIVSAVKDIKGNVMIDIPPVFGHRRCQYSKDKYENLFYKCSVKNLSQTNNQYEIEGEKFVLAKDAANFILNIINSNSNSENFYSLSPEIKTYTIKELYRRFYSYCNQNSKDELIESLMSSCHPFPPQDDKSITLSIVSTLSNNPDYLKRALINFDVFDYFLPFYPSLPFELVLVMVGEKIPKILKIGENLKKHVKFINIPLNVYKSLLNKLRIDYFPEFIMRNVGIRRSQGEFIACITSDSVPNIQLYDSILHRQFNLNSYVRTYRKYSSQNKSIIIDKLNYYSSKTSQNLIYHIEKTDFRNILNSKSCGDFQLTHWRIWKAVKGYIEGKEVFHIDSALGLDLVALVPSPLLMKVIGFNLHLDHPKISHRTYRFLYWNYLNMSEKGYISANSYRFRNNWGLSYLSNLPKVYF